MTQKLSLHRVLSELKMLDRRISDAISGLNPAVVSVNGKLKETGLQLDAFKSKAEAGYQQVTDLIQRRYDLKRALIKANAETKVTIAGKEMSIADAIDSKSVIEYKESLLRYLRKKYTEVTARYQNEVDKMESKLEDTIKAATNKAEKPDKDIITTLTDSFRKSYSVEMIDPIHLADVINTLSTEIDEFKSEVDAVLAEANATTFVEV